MKTKNMSISLLYGLPTTLGSWARNLRMDLELSRKEIAGLAKVSTKSVDLLENNEPLILDNKRRILAALYLQKAKRFG
jgi:transcriptional regulator with XRE-family HTH domain